MLFMSLLTFFAGTVSARTIYLTRHGQVGGKKNYVTAAREQGLTDLGREQARLLGKYLKNEYKFNGKIMVSPLHRTIDTGLEISAVTGSGKVILEPGLQELVTPKNNYGMTGAQIEGYFPGKTIPGSTFDDNWRIREEDAAARQKRISAAVKRILAETEGDLLLVGHGGVVGGVVNDMNNRRAGGVKPIRGTAWNCCLFTFELDENNKVVKSSYTTRYMPDEKVTHNFNVPKVPKPHDKRYKTRKPVKKVPAAVKPAAAKAAAEAAVLAPSREPGERMVYIARHCQAKGRKGDKYIRPIKGDSGVTDRGVQQSLLLGKRLKELGFNGPIFASPYYRTVATACHAAGVCGSKVYPDARVQERVSKEGGNIKNGGASLKQLKKLFPKEIAADAKLDSDWLLKKKERHSVQNNRLKKAIDELLAENPGKDIMIVSHAGAVSGIYYKLTGKRPDGKKEYIWNCVLFKFAVNAEGKFRYLGYDISFMPEEILSSNDKMTYAEFKAGWDKKAKSGVDYRY